MREKIICDKNNGKELIDLILHCLLDKDKIKNVNIKVKNNKVKIWLYDKISYEEIEKYNDYYKKEISMVKEKLNK